MISSELDLMIQGSMVKKPGSKSASKLKTNLAPRADNPNRAMIVRNIRSTLKLLGEDDKREGLLRTPDRYAKAMEFLTSGYKRDIDELVGKALFAEGSSDIVVVRDIELFSLCEHHLLPFFGRAHVAYIPNGKIIGLSKIPRVIDAFSRRLQVQERLTSQVASELQRILDPIGVAVIIEASHLCMMMRGVEKQNSYTITSCMLGAFRDDQATRTELMALLGGLGANSRR
jgi:GTP cyclohydrolase I